MGVKSCLGGLGGLSRLLCMWELVRFCGDLSSESLGKFCAVLMGPAGFVLCFS